MQDVHRTDLIRLVAKRAGIGQALAERVMDAVVDQIADTLAAERAVVWTGLARFEVRRNVPKRARNPRTGEPMLLPTRTTVGTVISPAFKLRAGCGTESEEAAAD